MKYDEALTKKVVDYLNSIIEIDQFATNLLFSYRVPANPSLANHPTVQCLAPRPGTDDPALVGFIGLLNGLVGTMDDGGGPIAINIDPATFEISKFVIRDDYTSSNSITTKGTTTL